jgi:hypothetical protein
MIPTDVIAEMEKRLQDQEKWGKRNTSSLANQIAAAKRARRLDTRLRVENVGRLLVVTLFSLLFWIVLLDPLWVLIR